MAVFAFVGNLFIPHPWLALIPALLLRQSTDGPGAKWQRRLVAHGCCTLCTSIRCTAVGYVAASATFEWISCSYIPYSSCCP
jgi:hypothetical protein